MTTSNTYALQDKVALVTGAGSGIGRAIAQGFVENGARVAVSGRRPDPLAETVAAAPAQRTLVVPSDVSVANANDHLVDQVVGRFGRLDIVVVNAATYASGDLTDMPRETWETLFAVNVDALFHLAKAALPHLEVTGGTLIAISSVSGAGGDWGQAAYNASKHAVNGLVRSLALDWGSRGVRVNAVAPAFTLTDMTAHVGQTDDDLAPFINRIALRRPGRPEDVVGAVMFLATSDAAYITGTVLPVDGGTSASTGQPAPS